MLTELLSPEGSSSLVFDLSSRTRIEVTGQDRARFLHNFCTNDVMALAPGQGAEAFFCNAKGRVLAHATLLVEQESIWLETVGGAAPNLLSHLDRYIIREDVTLHDRSNETEAMALVGAGARSLFESFLSPLTDGNTHPGNTSSFHGGRFTDEAGAVLQVWHVDWLTIPTLLVFGSPTAVQRNRQRLQQDGVSWGDSSQWDLLRISSGFPEYGVDITSDQLPQEVARTARCISFRKGCYLGQEPVARLDALGHTNRELRRLELLDSQTIPSAGTPLFDRETPTPVGQITSAAQDPSGRRAVALAYLKTKWTMPGTVVRGSQEEPIQLALVLDVV